MNRKLHGFSFTPPEQPRMVHASPWWACTFSFSSTSDVTVNCNAICNVFRDQVGLFKLNSNGRIDIAVRFVRASVYCLVAGRPISVCFHGITSTDYNTVLEDWPSQTALARVGYEWPLADQTCVLDDASTRTVLKVDTRADTIWISFIQLLWRPTTQSKIALTELYNQAHSVSSSFSDLHL
jgi:hypothetical protein